MKTNESKGNMYPGVKTWNPLAGECPHKCIYCSTCSLMRYPVIEAKYSGKLRLDEKAMNKNLGSGNTWFVCAQNDLFAKYTPLKFASDIIHQCHKYPDNRYYFQTKNPGKFCIWFGYYPAGSILCTTIETNRWYEQMGNAPVTGERAIEMHRLANPNIWGYEKQVTIEPIMDFDLKEMVELIEYANPNKVNIGADSKNNHLPEPSKEKLLALIDELKKFTLIDQKRNLKRLL
jgi:hypothetical protein